MQRQQFVTLSMWVAQQNAHRHMKRLGVYFRILEKVRESGHAEKEECPDESKPRGKESAIDGAA
jgi:hypothetical protein